MAKYIVVGCPGSGKSTMTFKMQEILKCPVLHLDKVYHIDNNTRISREELLSIIEEFSSSNENWIIDGNYVSTFEHRVKLADTIVLLDMDTKVCINNAINRSKKERTTDMAAGFDVSKLDDSFISFIASFKTDTLPKMLNVLDAYKDKKRIIILKDYQQVDRFLQELK